MLRSRDLEEDMRFKAASYIFSEGKRLEKLSLSLMSLLVVGHSEAHLGPGGVVAPGQGGGSPAQGPDGPGEPEGEGVHHRRADAHHDEQYPAVDLVVGPARAQVTTGDEIGELAFYFNRMAGAIEQNVRDPGAPGPRRHPGWSRPAPRPGC